jgi:hypothetical protein|tara:strand:- start:102 stop:290 length:189 start_codon:yes stop_codon:yes gene_type:complete
MKQIVIHRDQANDKLETIVFNDILTAKAAQHDLRKNYYDTILLSEQELLELKLKVNHASQAI